MTLVNMALKFMGRRSRKRLVLMAFSFTLIISMYVTIHSLLNKKALIGDGHRFSLFKIIEFDRNISNGEEWMDAPQKCMRPKLELWHPSMKQHVSKPEPLHCDDSQPDWVYIDNSTFRLYPDIEEKVGKITCECKPIIRDNDDLIRLGDAVRPFKDGDTILSDFFEVRCISAKGAVYKNIHSAILPKASKADERHVNPPDFLGMNVLMLGFDSVSRLNWMRNLPKSHKYLVDALGGTVLEGYNIVGDGTPQALLPILTGNREEELPEARRGFKNAGPVDNHPWIWQDLHKHGYVTQWGEDGAEVGTFNYRMMGFKDPPVHHYMRPFYLMAEKNYYSKNYAYCLGSKSRHVNMLQWIEHFFKAYRHTPKFSFLFHSELSHDYFSTLSLVDNDLLEFLKTMNRTGLLDNTMLILMSDHGSRFAHVRNTQQGKFEERLPYFSFRLPKWFKDKYPKAMKNLESNAHGLTTPFDIHATFHHMLNFHDNRSNSHTDPRGISLFKNISENRTCHQANIAPHWCTCMEWIETSLEDRFVKAAAQELVKAINYVLRNYAQCQNLTLAKIEDAVKFSPNERILKFKQSKDDHGRQGDFTDRMHPTVQLYQVTIVTKPGGGRFEATVKHDTYKKNSTFTVDYSAISRTNRYGSQPHCVMAEHPHLRPYCYCRTQLAS